MSFASLRERLRHLSWRGRRRNRRHLLGRRGERVAARYLSRRRYRILTRNYRCDAGEIDLICLDAGAVVFVEIKTRTSDQAQDLQESIRPNQWRRIENAARYYVMQHSLTDRACRFDVVTVLWPQRGAPKIEHFVDAFQARRA